MPNIACIILAAGESSRLGFPKQLVRYNGESLIQNICRKVKSLDLYRTICITGAYNVEVRESITNYDLELIHNNYYQNGMSESIMKGIRALLLDADVDATLIALCDQPLIPIDHFKLLIRTYISQSSQIVTSEYHDTYGVPAVFDKSCFKSLLTLDQGGGAKRIIREYMDNTSFVRCDKAAFDIDTPEALDTLKSLELNPDYSSM